MNEKQQYKKIGVKVFGYIKKNGELTGEKFFGVIYKTYKNYPWLVEQENGKLLSVNPEDIYIDINQNIN